MHTVRRSTHRKRTLRIALAAVATAAVLATTACTGAGGDPLSSAAPDKLENFTFTSWNYGEDAQKQLITDEAAAFTDGKGIEADLASYPFAEYRNQILLRSKSGELTGAAQLDIADINTLAQLGVLEDLSSVAKDAGYTDAALKTGQVDGEQLGLPWYTGSIGLVANTELLKQAGVDTVPTTVAEFEDALLAVQKLGGDYVPYALATKPETIKDFIPWFRTFGSEILDGDTIKVNDDGAVKALTWLKSLLDRKLIQLNIGRPEARTLYSQEKAAFFDDANQVRGTITSQATDPDLLSHTSPIPRPVVTSGDTPQSLTWGGLIVVFKNGPAATAAAFAKFQTSDTKNVLARYTAVGSVPTTTEATSDASFTGDPYNVAWQKNITNSAQPNPLWVFPEYSQMEAKLATEIQSALIGDKSPKDALDAAAAEMQALVK